VLAAYDQSGTLDPAFGSGGKVVVQSDLYEVGVAVAVQADGRIVVGGYSHDNSRVQQLASVWRLEPDGSLDLTFGNNGWASDPIADASMYPICYGLALQSDGKIVWAAHIANNGFMYPVLARFWP